MLRDIHGYNAHDGSWMGLVSVDPLRVGLTILDYNETVLIL
jgi:hypothetical protein